jgi:hypothetical protein
MSRDVGIYITNGRNLTTKTAIIAAKAGKQACAPNKGLLRNSPEFLPYRRTACRMGGCSRPPAGVQDQGDSPFKNSVALNTPCHLSWPAGGG